GQLQVGKRNRFHSDRRSDEAQDYKKRPHKFAFLCCSHTSPIFPYGMLKFTTWLFSASVIPVRALGSDRLLRLSACALVPAKSEGSRCTAKCMKITVWPGWRVMLSQR